MNNDDRVLKIFFYTIANYRALYIIYIYLYSHTTQFILEVI